MTVELTTIDFQSATWHTIRSWAEEQLALARTKVEKIGLPADDTNALRGEIRALKQLIGLPDAARRHLEIARTSVSDSTFE